MKTKNLYKRDESCCTRCLKSFDFYKDLPDSLSEPTLTGASVSIVLLLIITGLLGKATYDFLQYNKTSDIMIDVSSGEEKLHINLDITIPHCPCDILSLDIVDVTGVHVVDIEGKLHKIRLDERGNQIGVVSHIDETGHAEVDSKKQMTESHQKSLEGRETTQKIYEATVKGIERKEGCKLTGFVFINKVPGNFHISMHHYPEAFQHLMLRGYNIDFSHKINHLSFGDLEDVR